MGVCFIFSLNGKNILLYWRLSTFKPFNSVCKCLFKIDQTQVGDFFHLEYFLTSEIAEKEVRGLDFQTQAYMKLNLSSNSGLKIHLSRTFNNRLISLKSVSPKIHINVGLAFLLITVLVF